jgi:hypothetical protein
MVRIVGAGATTAVGLAAGLGLTAGVVVADMRRP